MPLLPLRVRPPLAPSPTSAPGGGPPPQENDILSKKFFVLYGLCEQQLSKQPHYDFGLRNILSVLRTAGASKRQSPDKSEVFLMMRTLRDMNMSKFVSEDVPLFLSLIDDLFPGLKADRNSFPDVRR